LKHPVENIEEPHGCPAFAGVVIACDRNRPYIAGLYGASDDPGPRDHRAAADDCGLSLPFTGF